MNHRATMGAGTVVKNRLHLGLAGNVADRIRDVLFSMVVRF